jgi:hypothetical protein
MWLRELQGQSGLFEKEKNFLPLPVFKHRVISAVDQSLYDYAIQHSY